MRRMSVPGGAGQWLQHPGNRTCAGLTGQGRPWANCSHQLCRRAAGGEANAYSPVPVVLKSQSFLQSFETADSKRRRKSP